MHWDIVLAAATPGISAALVYLVLGKRRWGSWLWWWRR